MAEMELAALRWRTGRRVGRTIYAQLTEHPSDVDPLIGVMDSIGLAIATVRAHNAEHEREHSSTNDTAASLADPNRED